MEEIHRESLRKNFSTLVAQTDLDLMVAALYEKGVFSDAMIEPYKDTSKIETNRKRQLYRDITRRGPEAFRHLVDALRENGYWDLVRDLDPNNSLMPVRRPIPSLPTHSGDSRFLSLSDKNKRYTGKEQHDPNQNQASSSSHYHHEYKSPSRENENGNISPTPVAAGREQDVSDQQMPGIPHFNVIKSTKFFEDKDSDIKLYRTRGRNRGVLVLFSYVSFLHDIETYRQGALVDADNLRYLFSELGFKVLVYKDLSYAVTKETLSSLKQGACAERPETVFIVFSSHGYPRPGSGDIEIRCHDGKLLSFYDVIEYFNHDNFPALRGIPKVFIFQTCRGSNSDYTQRLPRPLDPPAVPPAPAHDGHPCPPSPRPARRAARAPHVDDWRRELDRIYSDILIAHSTVPGHVSHRDEHLGSWYIQALCDVFAARAHDCHIEDLFTLVDERMRKQFATQTSSVDRWGFNRRLYLHPGLFED